MKEKAAESWESKMLRIMEERAVDEALESISDYSDVQRKRALRDGTYENIEFDKVTAAHVVYKAAVPEIKGAAATLAAVMNVTRVDKDLLVEFVYEAMTAFEVLEEALNSGCLDEGDGNGELIQYGTWGTPACGADEASRDEALHREFLLQRAGCDKIFVPQSFPACGPVFIPLVPPRAVNKGKAIDSRRSPAAGPPKVDWPEKPERETGEVE